jgi:hypothetical protein
MPEHKPAVGSRAQVWHGTAKHTSGGLEKHQLMMNKNGRIVSRKKHASAKKDKRLLKAGYGTQKGKFGFVRLNGTRKTRRGGGMTPLTPASLSSMGSSGDVQGTNSSSLASTAGQAGGRRRRHRRGGSGMSSLSFSSTGGRRKRHRSSSRRSRK